MKKALFSIFLCILFTYCSLLTSVVQADKQAILVNSSHPGVINDIIYDEIRNLLLSGGEDGTVRIWDLSTEDLLCYVRVSHQPVQKIAVHPQLTQIAVLVEDSLNTFSISVWDWLSGNKLYSFNITEQPLFLDYSPQGKYLIYSRAKYNGLSVLNPQTGKKLPYLRKGFGIVSYFVVSGNERNIMTYQPSGWISYWDIRSGKNLKQVKTIPNMTAIVVSPSKRFITASTGEKIVVVDLLTGAVAAQTDLPGIKRLAMSMQGNAITAIVERDKGTILKQYYFNEKSLSEIPMANMKVCPVLSCVTYGQKQLYLADREGGITVLRPGGSYTLIFKNSLLPISDLAFRDDSMAVGSADRILVFSSAFFSADSVLGRGDALHIDRDNFRNPLSVPVGLDFLDNANLLLWKKNDEPGIIAVLNRKTGKIENTISDFSSPIIQLEVLKQGILTVEKSGLCKIINSETYLSRFQYLSPGMNKLISTEDNILIGGKSSASAFGSPLLQLNQITGETVSIPDPGLFIYDLLYVKKTRLLFSLGVERSKNDSTTILKVHSGAGYQKQKAIYRFYGEDLSASMASDRSGNVYTSLSYNSVTVWNGRRIFELERSNHIPRKLYIAGGKLFSLNRDSSITVWDLKSRRILFNIYIFRDASWVALSSDGKVFSSSTSGKHLSRHL